MKKLVKRLLAVLMALAMMATVLSTVAFAATPQNVKQYKSYVSLGDSIAAGFSIYWRKAKKKINKAVGREEVTKDESDNLEDL